jgi:hypothetical protein
MGVHTTLDITRTDAIYEITNALRSASDQELENVLYSLYGDKLLYNFSIVPDYKGEWSHKYCDLGKL